MNILYEIIEKDDILSSIEFDFDDDEQMTTKLCSEHEDRIMHFYCSNH